MPLRARLLARPLRRPGIARRSGSCVAAAARRGEWRGGSLLTSCGRCSAGRGDRRSCRLGLFGATPAQELDGGGRQALHRLLPGLRHLLWCHGRQKLPVLCVDASLLIQRAASSCLCRQHSWRHGWPGCRLLCGTVPLPPQRKLGELAVGGLREGRCCSCIGRRWRLRRRCCCHRPLLHLAHNALQRRLHRSQQACRLLGPASGMLLLLLLLHLVAMVALAPGPVQCTPACRMQSWLGLAGGRRRGRAASAASGGIRRCGAARDACDLGRGSGIALGCAGCELLLHGDRREASVGVAKP